MKIFLIIIGFGGLLSGCVSKPYSEASPERWYQAAEDRDPSRKTELVRTFSLKAPEGKWTFWGPYNWGGLIFRGRPEGLYGRYASYEVKVWLESGKFRHKERQLVALRSKDFSSYVEDSMNESRRFYAGLRMDGNDAGHPIPRKYDMGLTTYRSMTCIRYEKEGHIFIASSRSGASVGEQGEGDGAEEYDVVFSCPGFHGGKQAVFSYGVHVVVDNRHVPDGVHIDAEALKVDVLNRLHRAMDSVRFDGDFTQEVPEVIQLM